jgi:hypothetical protein
VVSGGRYAMNAYWIAALILTASIGFSLGLVFPN